MGDRKVLYLLSFPKPRLKLAEVEGKFFFRGSVYISSCSKTATWSQSETKQILGMTAISQVDTRIPLPLCGKNVFMNTALE